MRSIGRIASSRALPPSGSRYVVTTHPPSCSTRSEMGASSGVIAVAQSRGARPADFAARFRRTVRFFFGPVLPSAAMRLYSRRSPSAAFAIGLPVGGETLRGRGYRRVKGKYRIEPCDLKHARDAGLGRREAQFSACALHRVETFEHQLRPRAVHVLDAAQIEDQLPLVLFQQVLNHVDVASRP